MADEVVEVPPDPLPLRGDGEHGVAAVGGLELLLQHLLADAVPDAPGHDRAHHGEARRDRLTGHEGDRHDGEAHQQHRGHRPPPGQQQHMRHGLEHHHVEHVQTDHRDQHEQDPRAQREPDQAHPPRVQRDPRGGGEHRPVQEQQRGGEHHRRPGRLDPAEHDRDQHEHHRREGEREPARLPRGPEHAARGEGPGGGLLPRVGGVAGPPPPVRGVGGAHGGHCASVPHRRCRPTARDMLTRHSAPSTRVHTPITTRPATGSSAPCRDHSPRLEIQ